MHLQALNTQKGQIVLSVREIFRSKKWLETHIIPWNLTLCLHYDRDNYELKRNTELMKNNLLVLKNIGHADAPGVVFADSNISSELLQSPRQLVVQLKSSKDDCNK